MASKQVEIRWLNRVFGRNDLAALARDGRDAAKAQDEFATSAARAAHLSKRAAAEMQAASTEMRKGTEGLKAAMSGLGQSGGSGLDAIARQANLATLAIRGTTLAAGALVTAASAGLGAANQVAAQAQRERNLSAQTGFSPQEAGIFSRIAEENGVNVNVITIGIKGLSRALAENSTEGKRAQKALADLGVTTKDVYGVALPTRDLFLNIGEAINKVRDPIQQLAIAQRIFGEDAGQNLLPLFQKNLRQSVEELRKLGVGLDQVGAESARRFKDNINDLNTRLTVIKQTLGVFVADGLNPAIERLVFFLDLLNSQPRRSGNGPAGLIESLLVFNARAVAGSTPTQVSDADVQGTLASGSRSQIDRLAANRFRLQATAADLPRRTQAVESLLFGGDADGLQRQLQRAQKDLQDAQDRTDDVGVAAALNRVNALKARIENIKKTATATEAVQGLVASTLDSLGAKALSPLADLYFQEQRKLRELAGRANGVVDTTAASAQIRGAFEARRNELINDLLDPSKVGTKRSRDLIPDLFSTAFLGAPRQGVFRTSEAEIASANQAGQAAKLPKTLSEERANALEVVQRRVRAVQATLQYEERISLLTAGPGGQVAAINRIAELRVRAARDEYAITKDLAALQEKTLDAQRERTVAILELAQRQRDAFRDGAGQLFDSLRRGGTVGVGDFFRGQLENVQRTVFQNVASMGFSAVQRSGFQLPGVGTAANPTLIGKLLEGTPFGPNALNDLPQATNRNTLATQENTAALRAVALGRAGAAIAGGSKLGALAGAPSIFGGADAILNAASNNRSSAAVNAIAPAFSFLPGLSSSARSAAILNTASNNRASQSLNLALGTNFIPAKQPLTLGQQVGMGAAISGQIAGGALLAVSGFREGGARGTLQGISGALGAAAAIPGPQQGFLMAGSMLAGFVGSILPDPRKIRDGIIESTLNASRADLPTGSTFETDLSGSAFDYGANGRIRVIQGQVNVHTMDARSFLDNRDLISEAVRVSLTEGGQLGQEIKQQVVA